MNRGINYLAENWANIDPKENPQTLAVVTYVLHLAVHPQKDQVQRYFYILLRIPDPSSGFQFSDTGFCSFVIFLC